MESSNIQGRDEADINPYSLRIWTAQDVLEIDPEIDPDEVELVRLSMQKQEVIFQGLLNSAGIREIHRVLATLIDEPEHQELLEYACARLGIQQQ